MDLSGKIAVVTGGAGGIGKEVAESLGKAGAELWIADIRQEMAEEAVRTLQTEGVLVRYAKTDVTELEEIRRLIASAAEESGRIDILVNCAGVSSLSKVPEITPDEWDLIFRVNLRSAFFCSQEALKYMTRQEEGRIVNVASASAKIGGIAVGAHYSASKAGIICLTKSLALYGAPYGITVNCVCPGPIKTSMTDDWGSTINSAFAEDIPLKRYGTAQEVAYAIGFLVSDEAGYVTGETLDVNGGLVMD